MGSSVHQAAGVDTPVSRSTETENVVVETNGLALTQFSVGIDVGQVKLAVSGSWESALLKVTWPDDLTPDDNLVGA